MFAVIYINGKQQKVSEKDEILVDLMSKKEGENFKIKEVLLLSDDEGNETRIGMPFVSGAHVECQVMGDEKAEKVTVFKFHSKKRYSRKQGHRQKYTRLKVLKISAVEKKASAVKKEVAEEKVLDTKTEVKKPTSKKKATPKTAKA